MDPFQQMFQNFDKLSTDISHIKTSFNISFFKNYFNLLKTILFQIMCTILGTTYFAIVTNIQLLWKVACFIMKNSDHIFVFMRETGKTKIDGEEWKRIEAEI